MPSMPSQRSPVAAATCVLMMAMTATIVQAFTVCVIPDPPWVTCTYNVTDRLSFSGYDVEMFRFVAAQVGWRETVDHDKGVAGTVESGDWAFRCSTLFWGNVMDQMAGKTDSSGADIAPCAVALGDIISQAKRYNLGVQFSAPYYHTGLAIMVATAPPAPFDHWGFLKPFGWTLWLGLGVTLLVMPCIVWFVEYMSLYGRIALTKESAFDIKRVTYECIMACFNIGVYQVTTFPAQVVIIAYLFLMLITVSSYTANLAAVFTNAGGSIVTINSWKDLRDLPVGTPSTYIPGLQTRYGLKNMVPGNGANLDQLIAGKQGLLNGSISAYVTNLESLQGFLGSGGYNTDCSLALLLFDVVEPAFNFAIAFHHLFPRTLVNTNVSNAVMLAEETGLIYFLHEKYLHYESSCVATAASEPISFSQLSGLWILLGGALGVALIYTIIRVIVVARRHMKEIEQEELSGQPSDGLESAPSAGAVGSKTQLLHKAMTRVFVKGSASMHQHSDAGGDTPINGSFGDYTPNESRRVRSSSNASFGDGKLNESRRSTPTNAGNSLSLGSKRFLHPAVSLDAMATYPGGGTVPSQQQQLQLPPQPLHLTAPGRLGSGLGMARLGSMPRSGSISDDFPVSRVEEGHEEA